MRFEDLPSDWAQRPVTDPDVFEGVADLIATERSRARGGTWALLCHPNGRLLRPVLVEHGAVGSGPTSAAEVGAGLGRILTEASRQEVRDVALVAARPGPAEPTAHDREVVAALESACRAAGVRLHAVALAGDDGVRAVALGGSAAAA
jgi:hypothetical protein